MDSNFLQGAGLLLCIGGIVLAGLLVFGISRAFGSRSPRQMDRESEDVFRERGTERPRYDSDEVESHGGFGSGPRSSRPSSPPRRDRTSGPDLDDRLRGDLSGDRPSREERPARQRRDDDPDIRSGGGFGG